VVGVSPRTGEELFFGNVPSELLARCDCSILFVSDPSSSSGELHELKSAGSVGSDNAREKRTSNLLNTPSEVAVPDLVENYPDRSNAIGGRPRSPLG